MSNLLSIKSLVLLSEKILFQGLKLWLSLKDLEILDKVSQKDSAYHP